MKIETLTTVTGKKLTLVFGSTDGALSSAKYEGKDVTSELHYLRKGDFILLLSLLGFQPRWDEEKVQIVHKLTERLDKLGLTVHSFGRVQEGLEEYEILLKRKDDSRIYSTVAARALYNPKLREFSRVIFTPHHIGISVQMLNSSL